MEMLDVTWQHQKYARPEIYVVTLVNISSLIGLIFNLRQKQNSYCQQFENHNKSRQYFPDISDYIVLIFFPQFTTLY